MTKRIPDVPGVPSVPPISEAGQMEECVLDFMSSFGELICSVGEKIASVFKKKSNNLDSTIGKIIETKGKNIKEDKEDGFQREGDSQLIETDITTIEDLCSILKKGGRLDYQNSEVSKLVNRIIGDARNKETNYKLLIDNLYKIDGVDQEFISKLARSIDYLFEKLWSRKCLVVDKSGGSTFDYQLELDIRYIRKLRRFKKYRKKILEYLQDLNKINHEIH